MGKIPAKVLKALDEVVTDKRQFIEDNWRLGRIGGSSFDGMAGSLLNLFEFEDGGNARKLFLDPSTGQPRQ